MILADKTLFLTVYTNMLYKSPETRQPHRMYASKRLPV